jgi:hypothetical protein
MNALQNITIPQPCHQSWQQMESKNNGRHCTHCSKTVIDFTKMTNAEIIGYLSITNNVCGRFASTQLEATNQILINQDLPGSRSWKSWLMAAGLFGATFFIKANAQTKATNSPPTEQSAVASSDINEPMIGKVAVNNTLKTRVIKGQVLDNGKVPIFDAMINVYGGSTTAITDVNGAFSISVPVSARRLVISSVGYSSKEIAIDLNTNKIYQINLGAHNMVMGGVAVYKGDTLKQRLYKIIKKQ